MKMMWDDFSDESVKSIKELSDNKNLKNLIHKLQVAKCNVNKNLKSYKDLSKGLKK